MRKYSLLPGVLVLIMHGAVFAASPEAVTSQIFNKLATGKDTVQLENFLENFPKGGDIHNHPVGAGMAEPMMSYAKNDNLCVDSATYKVAEDANCDPRWRLNTLSNYPDSYNALIDAWSMRNFIPGTETGRLHFFHAFGKFDYINRKYADQILEEVVNRAGEQNTVYLELTADQLDEGKADELAKTLKWDDSANWNSNFKRMQASLEKPIQSVADTIVAVAKSKEALLAKNFQCDSSQPKKGCGVAVRYLYPVLRMSSPESVFTQIYAGFLAANANSLVVGMNMAQPEDKEVPMRDYKLHMEMFHYFHKMYPKVHVTLHAGELAPGLVPDDGLRSHIHDAVTVAHAERIGHGVDITHEDNYKNLLDKMSRKHILVEINLSSNEAILATKDAEHPFPLYMKHNVPVTLSTDDEGILRTRLSREYFRAVKSYNLTYPVIKTLSRNSLTYAFIPGASLWSDYDYKHVVKECDRGTILGERHPPAECTAFLNNNPKAFLQWELEKRFSQFENKVVQGVIIK